ncbi:Gfo/Idh/MocA family oxidoreductase [Oxyplasma meridianum]|uniref:Gfo/Idh/MocA family oxidoreductase n=1 Tax=Oxyplasma meridianum TaxID=3073602 RepID=A0AAX4NGT7_9ARCH
MKVTLIGGNGFGKLHGESYKQLGIEFSVYDRNPEVLEYYRKNYGVKEVFDNIDDAIHSNSDIADIVLPHKMHRDISIRCMELGKHVIMEKPIATTIEEATEIIEASVKNNVKFMVAEQYNFDPSLNMAIKLVNENMIGKVHTILVRDQREYKKTGWRSKKEEMGGGALIDGGIHYIETILDIGGDYSRIDSYSYHGGSSLEGEDTTVALFHFTSGSHGMFFYSWAYRSFPRLPSYEIIGSEGSIYEDIKSRPLEEFKSMTGLRYVYGNPVLNGEKVEIHQEDVFNLEIKGFVDSVKNNTEVPYSHNKAIRNLRSILDIYRKGD